MIPCQECGHVNKLGTMYCGVCGSKLDMSMSDIEASVMATAADQREQKLFLAGRNTLSIGVFLIVSAWVFTTYVVPTMPPAEMPRATPLEPRQLLSDSASWLSPGLQEAPALAIDDLVREEENLMSWRKRQKDFLLPSSNTTRIANWQIEIYNSRNRDGSWPGPDPVASTGLGMLALMSHPALSEFDTAIQEGAEFLKPLVIDGSSRRHPIAQTLGIMALVESGTLSEREAAALKPLIMKGDSAKWQALALASFPPDSRPDRIAAIRANTEDPIWRHFLHFYSDRPLIEELDTSLFEPGAGDRFTGVDRIAWACTSWFIGQNAEDLGKSLHDWSNADAPPPIGGDLARLAGDHAPYCMAVLAATAPLRTPIPWVRRPNPDNN